VVSIAYLIVVAFYLQTPHVPPSLAQCLQYLQFLQAWHGYVPVQVDEKDATGVIQAISIRSNNETIGMIREYFLAHNVATPH
jgi:hypothetical protein